MGKHSTGAGWELRMGRDGIQMMVTLRKRQMTWHEVVSCSQDVQLGTLQVLASASHVNPTHVERFNNRHAQASGFTLRAALTAVG